MKVLYELDLNDIIRIVAEKYEVPQEKVKKTNKDGLNYLMIDMSETETPITTREYMDLFHPKKKSEPTDEEIQEMKYKLITDEVLHNAIKNNLKVSDICKEYCLTEKKYAQRLYARVNSLIEGNKKSMDEETKNLIRRLKKTQTKRIESGMTVYTCPVCQKEFNTEKYPDYAYKKQIFNQKHIFCGYACMREAEKLM